MREAGNEKQEKEDDRAISGLWSEPGINLGCFMWYALYQVSHFDLSLFHLHKFKEIILFWDWRLKEIDPLPHCQLLEREAPVSIISAGIYKGVNASFNVVLTETL